MSLDFIRAKNPPFSETLERLRIVSGMDNHNWLDLLQMNWTEYTLIRAGLRELPDNAFLNLSSHFKFNPEMIIQGEIDFKDLQIKLEKWKIPETYSYATYGRSRTTITSFDYLEKFHNWKIRYDVLKHLSLSESMLTDSFAPISMKVITDSFEYLSKRQFQEKDFFSMGLFSYVANAGSLLGSHYSQLRSSREVLEKMWGECLEFYEENCLYKFVKLDNHSALLEVVSDPYVAEEMGVRHLGNKHICSLKAGMIASAPMYIGYPLADVTIKSCVHQGAPSCLYEVKFPQKKSSEVRLPILDLTNPQADQNRCGCSKH